MNKYFTFFGLILLLFYFHTVQAQVEYGFLGSFNLSKLSGDFREPSDRFPVMNYSGGIGMEVAVNFTKNIALQIEPMFMERGGQNGQPGELWQKIHLTYFDLPVYAKYSFKIPYLMIGYFRSYLSTADLKYGRKDRNNIKDLLNRNDHGISLGIGFNIPVDNKNKFILEALYHKGFSNLKDVEGYVGEEMKLQGLQFKVGAVFMISFSSGESKKSEPEK